VRAIQSVSAGGQVRIWAREDRVLRQVRLGICGNEALADGIEGEGSSFDGPASNGSKSTESRSFCLGTIVARELAARNLGRLREQWSARGGMRLWFDVPLAVPGEVIDRYLTRLRSLPGQPGEVCLLRARLDSDGGADRRQQIDRQLNVLLRPNDLLLRTGRADWLILIPPPRDFGRRMDRLANSVNSARYMNGRSTLAIVQAGTWSIERCASDLVAEMEIDELYSVGPTALTNQRVQDLSECTA